MKFEIGWGSGLTAAFILAGAAVMIRGELASRQREREGIERCASQCRIAGLCRYDLKLRACRPRSSADCAQADVCKASGLCSFEDGLCRASTDEDCRASEQCKETGRCKRNSDSAIPCVPATTEDCKSSTICRRFGRCTSDGTSCFVATREDCLGSEACTRNGHCSVRRLDSGAGVVASCAATSNDDCALGEDCKARGSCTAVDGWCR